MLFTADGSALIEKWFADPELPKWMFIAAMYDWINGISARQGNLMTRKQFMEMGIGILTEPDTLGNLACIFQDQKGNWQEGFAFMMAPQAPQPKLNGHARSL